MTEQPIDKRKETIAALRHASKHLSEVFVKMDKTDTIISDIISSLQRDAGKVGDVKIETWWENKFQVVSLKTILNYYANQLEKARI